MNLSVEFIPATWDGDTFIEPKLVIKALSGTFEDAKPIIEQLLADLGQDNIQLVFESPIESHQGDHGHLHVGVTKHA